MKALVNTAPGALELREVPAPEPGPGQVRVRVSACGICASDFEMIDGCPRAKFPEILGHEWSGQVEKCGPGVDASLLGRLCVAENVLPDGGEVGFEHPGGYGEMLVTEAANIHVLPDGFPMDEAALIEPLAVVVRGMARLRPAKGPAVVIGDGTIGLLALILLKHAGVEDVSIIGGREARLKLAMELGASKTLDYHKIEGSLADALAKEGKGPFESVVEAAKSDDAIPLAFKLGAHGAKILLIGNYDDKETKLPLQSFLLNEFELVSSNASLGAWTEAVRLAVTGKLPLGKLATHRYPASAFEDAMKTARTCKGAVKVLLCWSKQGAEQ